MRLGDSVVQTQLDSVGGAMWTGQVLMGRFTPMDLVFDTGSDWLVVESNQCGNCEGNTFNTGMSTQVGDMMSERVYGSARLEGIEFQDIVCIRFDVCVPNFEYFGIFNQTGIKEPIDGILGLSRNKWFY